MYRRYALAILAPLTAIGFAVSLAPAVDLPGGGKPTSDCYSVFRVTGGSASGTNKVLCSAGDPTCDKAGTCALDDVACTFEVQQCILVSTGSACTLPNAIVQNSGGGPLSGSLVTGSTSTCGPVVEVQVKAGKKRKIKVVSTSDGTPKKDPDSLTLTCKKRSQSCVVPPTTTTTVASTSSTSTSSSSTSSSSSSSTSTSSSSSTSSSTETTLETTTSTSSSSSTSSSTETTLETTTSTSSSSSTSSSTETTLETTTSTSSSSSTSSSTETTLEITTSTSSSSSTSSSTETTLETTTSTSSTTSTTGTTAPQFSKLKVQFKQGTTSCGGAALYQHCLTGNNLGGTNGLGACTVDADCGTSGTPDCTLPISPPAAPLAGRLNNANGQKLADLGAGCLYFGGGRGTNVPGGQIPVNSSTIFAVTGSNGSELTLGPSPGTSRTDCSLAGGPGLVCFNNANIGQPCTTLGTDPACSNVANACNPTPNCYFGPPLPIPNPANRTTQTCVVNVVDNLPGTTTPPSGTAHTATGEVTVGIGLRSHVYLTATSFGAETPCPRCINNVCNGGKRSGQACTPGGSLGTSVDCMPNDNQWAAPLAISLSPLTTETASQTGPANGLFCPGQAGLSPGAFGVKLARQIVETGTRVAGGIGTTPHQMTIGATFCIGSVNGVINAAGDLPGPGAFSLVADVSLLP